MKEYKVQELFEEKEGTKFKDTEGGTYIVKNSTVLKLYDDYEERELLLNKRWFETKFIKVETPVNFMEAVASNKRIKVIHSNFVSTDRFMTIPEMLNCMSRYSRPIELIECGKWYIEDQKDD